MKKKIATFIKCLFFWVEEGVAYYLTNKWAIVLICAVIAVFPTVLVKWVAFFIWGLIINFELIYFLFWCSLLILFVYEIGLPKEVKDRIKTRILKKIK